MLGPYGRSAGLGEFRGGPALVSGGADGTVRLWDALTGEQLVALNGSTGEIHAVVAATVDGHAVLVSGAADGAICAWDPTASEEIWRVSAPDLLAADSEPHTPAPLRVNERTPLLTDSPATGDELNREPIAVYVASQLSTMVGERPHDSFAIHLTGTWGIGKTSLVNFSRVPCSRGLAELGCPTQLL